MYLVISYYFNFIKNNMIHKNCCTVQYRISCVITLHNDKSIILHKTKTFSIMLFLLNCVLNVVVFICPVLGSLFCFFIIIACPSSVDGGMTWPATTEGMSVEMPCSSGSSQFRYNLNIIKSFGWLSHIYLTKSACAHTHVCMCTTTLLILKLNSLELLS